MKREEKYKIEQKVSDQIRRAGNSLSCLRPLVLQWDAMRRRKVADRIIDEERGLYDLIYR